MNHHWDIVPGVVDCLLNPVVRVSPLDALGLHVDPVQAVDNVRRLVAARELLASPGEHAPQERPQLGHLSLSPGSLSP